MVAAHHTPASLPQRFAWRREIAIASLLGCAVVCVALWDALFFIGSRTLGPWDGFAQSSSLTSVDAAGPHSLSVAGDQLRQFVPWAVFARGELAGGRVPLWCPNNGTGIPLLANYQSAVLSPFTLPLYVLPLKLGVLASTAGKLFVAAASAFLLLRSLGRSRAASAVGATAYGLAGFHLLCMMHPHIGVLALLPLGLLAMDRAAHGFAATQRLPLGALTGLASSLGAMALAGHPESLLFAVYFVAAFAAYQLARLAWSARGDRADLRRVARFAWCVLAAGLLGGLLGAVQMLPFLEYMLESASFATGERASGTPADSYLLLQMFPDVSGALLPSRGSRAGFVPGFHEASVYFVGGTTMILAVGALAFLRRSSETLFFLALGIAAMLYGFEAPFASALLGPLFGSGYVLAPRASPLWTLSACVLAAYTLDQLRERARSAFHLRALALIGGGVALLVACRVGMQRAWAELDASDPAAFASMAEHAHRYVDSLSVVIAAGLGAVSALAWSARTSVRTAAWSVLIAATAAQAWLGFDGANYAIDDRFVVPRTSAIEGLKTAVGRERVVLLSRSGLQSNTNLFYDIALISSYDALEVRDLDDLRAELFGSTGYVSATVHASRFALDLFGAPYVATRGDWLPIDGERERDAVAGAANWHVAAELGFPRRPRLAKLNRDRASVREQIVASRDGLDGLVVHFLDDAGVHAARATLELFDVERGSSLASRSVRLGELRRFGRDRLECVLEFPRIDGSAGRAYELEVRVDELAEGATISLIRPTALQPSASDGEQLDEDDERARPGGERRRFVLDLSYGREQFERVGEFGDFVLRRVRGAGGRAWIASGAVGVADRAAARATTLAAEFDPRTQAVIEGVESQPVAAGEFRLERIAEDSLSSRYRASCDAPAYLVLAQPHFPGWKARIGGREVPLLRANYAFTAVALAQGVSEIEIEYAPASFRIGWIATLAALLAIAAAVIVARRRG